MTNKEILDVVHEVLKASQEADMGVDTDQIVKEQINFIEQEWQKADDQERVDQYNRNREAKDHVSTVVEMEAKISDWYAWQTIGLDPDPCTNDVKEIERHRGLEIGEDGTVKDLI